MSLIVHVDTEGVRVPLAIRRVADVVRSVLRAERVGEAFLSVAFLSNRAIAALNARHLGRRGPTDVIAFGFAPPPAPPPAAPGPPLPVIGDVYIAPAVARENARRLGVGVREEIVRLVVHGTLHVLGYDHPEGAEREASPMWRRQEQLIARILRRAN